MNGLTVVLDAVSTKVATTATRMIATTISRRTLATGNAGADTAFTARAPSSRGLTQLVWSSVLAPAEFFFTDSMPFRALALVS